MLLVVVAVSLSSRGLVAATALLLFATVALKGNVDALKYCLKASLHSSCCGRWGLSQPFGTYVSAVGTYGPLKEDVQYISRTSFNPKLTISIIGIS